MQLEEGPHQSIEDDEVKTVWKGKERTSADIHDVLTFLVEMQARTSVETHVFLDGLWYSRFQLYSLSRLPFVAMYNHYKGVFDDYQRSTGEEHPDAWTLYFFSKAYCKPYCPDHKVHALTASHEVRPAIGDGMDEDSGGFISLSEVCAASLSYVEL